MSTIRVILNPVADRGHAADQAVHLRRLITEAAEAKQADIEWCETQHPRHATQLAQAAAEADVDIVIVLGGDGTVHEVVNGLLQAATESPPTLGIIPVGSGNDFAANLNLPADPQKAVTRIFSGNIRYVDAGKVTSQAGKSEYWNNTLGIGFSGSVNAVTREVKHLRGFLIYLWAVLKTIVTNPTDIEAQFERGDGITFTHRITMISVCNGPREGGGFPVAPNADPSDGLLTYTIMKRLTRLGILAFLPIVMLGQHVRFSRFENAHTSAFRITVDSPVDIHIDGEVFATLADPAQTYDITILPGALKIAV